MEKDFAFDARYASGSWRARVYPVHGSDAKSKGRRARYTGPRQRPVVVQLADTSIRARRKEDFIIFGPRSRALRRFYARSRGVTRARRRVNSQGNHDGVIEHVLRRSTNIHSHRRYRRPSLPFGRCAAVRDLSRMQPYAVGESVFGTISRATPRSRGGTGFLF